MSQQPKEDGSRAAEVLDWLEGALPVQRRVVKAGDTVIRAGARFTHLEVVNSGFFKSVSMTADGRDRVAGLHFKGDWLGLDGIAEGRHDCDAVAMDTGEVWSVGYETLIEACARQPRLVATLHAAMSREIARDRESLMSMCTLPADARVADFLHHWTDSLTRCGLRTDRVTLRMTRAEIGNYLGMTLESVSRGLTRLARERVISFDGKSRRQISIPDVQALYTYAQAICRRGNHHAPDPLEASTASRYAASLRPRQAALAA
jgi:CRP/FNR family transcriptional regulator